MGIMPISEPSSDAMENCNAGSRTLAYIPSN